MTNKIYRRALFDAFGEVAKSWFETSDDELNKMTIKDLY